MINKLKPGTKVKILVDTWHGPAGSTGVVCEENLTPGLTSVSYDDPEFVRGPIFDFDESYLQEVHS